MLFDLQAQGKVNLFATSRIIPDVTKRFDGSPVLEIRASHDDICRYLQGHMG